jgi:N-acetylmuramoyl-L-alanine amidase
MIRFLIFAVVFLLNTAHAQDVTLLRGARSSEGANVVLRFQCSSVPEIFTTIAQQPARVVVMVKGQADHRIFSDLVGGVVTRVSVLSAQSGWFRIEVVYTGKPRVLVEIQDKAILVSLKPSEVPLKIKTGRLKGYRIRRVAVDPGHGGEDFGARGASGLREKDVALDIGRRLVKELKGVGIEAFLTRTGDYYLNLRDRTMLANLKRADLFISIHADAVANNPSASGSAVYFCSEKASDKTAALLAQQENAVEKSEDQHQGQTIDFEGLLFRFERKLYWEDSKQFCRGIIDPMTQRAGTRKLGGGVKSANFSVLRNAKMPSLLVETAFISNPREERLLNTPTFRQQIAEGIVMGLKPWLERK